MGKIRIPVTIICLLLAFTAVAAKQTGMAPSLQPPLALEDGDRVVLLGNSLFENELRYGYLEYALTTRWADRDVSFRNLGWTGDTVFGEARGYFTNPPDAYGHLIDQLEKARPTMVILAYGTNEAYEGAKGLDRYIEGLNRLLDKIDELNARVVMLSPIPHFPVVARPEINTSHNENLTLYTKAQSGVADKRGVPFIDVFTTLRQNSRTGELTTNGMHLNERGYYYLAREMEKQLGLRERTWSVHIDAEKLQADRQGAVIWDLAADDAEPGVMTFKVLDATLPFPRPEGGAASGPAAGRTLRITGLAQGYYSFSMDGRQVASATAREWSDGVALSGEPALRQAGKLREHIVRKNAMFFYQYRPQNRTYLLGFRSHEQGNNAVELEQYDKFIEELEAGIAGLRSPAPVICRLTPTQRN